MIDHEDVARNTEPDDVGPEIYDPRIVPLGETWCVCPDNGLPPGKDALVCHSKAMAQLWVRALGHVVDLYRFGRASSAQRRMLINLGLVVLP